MSWKDDKDLGPGQWNFTKPTTKLGYINNPRWTRNPASINEHHPCGYWFDNPYIPGVVRFDASMYQQCVNVLNERGGIIAFCAPSKRTYNLQVAGCINYNGGPLGYRQIVAENPCGLPGSTIVKIINGSINVFYYTSNYKQYSSPYPRILKFYRLLEGGEGFIESTVAEDDLTSKLLYDPSNRKFMAVTSDNIIICIYVKDVVGVKTLFAVRSTNFGYTWSAPITIGTFTVYTYENNINLLCDDNDNLFIVYDCYYGATEKKKFKMFRSFDKGLTWGSITPLSHTQNCAYRTAACITENRIYVSNSVYTGVGEIWSVELYYSDDQGNTWTTENIMDTNYGAYSTALMAYGNTVVFIGVVYGPAPLWCVSKDIYRSIDAGANWDSVANIYAHNCAYESDFPKLVEVYPENVYISAESDGPVFVYTTCGAYIDGMDNLALLKSVDYGLTWTLMATPYGRIADFECIVGGMVRLVPIPFDIEFAFIDTDPNWEPEYWYDFNPGGDTFIQGP